MPDARELTMTGSTQCNLDIAAMQTTSHVLTGIASSIEDWTTVEGKETDNSGQTTAIHIAALSFTQSNVYRVYNSGKPIVEICKEYLKSDDIDSQAITIYPIGVDEQSDLNNGTVLQLLDDDRDINGGQISGIQRIILSRTLREAQEQSINSIWMKQEK